MKRISSFASKKLVSCALDCKKMFLKKLPIYLVKAGVLFLIGTASANAVIIWIPFGYNPPYFYSKEEAYKYAISQWSATGANADLYAFCGGLVYRPNGASEDFQARNFIYSYMGQVVNSPNPTRCLNGQDAGPFNINGVYTGETYPYDTSCSYDPNNLNSCNIQQTKIAVNNTIGKGQCNCERGNPINGGTGNKRQAESDYHGSGGNNLVLDRTYNSASMRNSRFGARWADSFQRLVMKDAITSDIAVVRRPDGKEIAFTLSSNAYVTNADTLDTLTVQKDGSGNITGWQYVVAADRSVEAYDGNGRLMSVAFPSGLSQSMNYSTASTPTSVATVPGLLLSVTDNFGHVMGLPMTATVVLQR